MKMPTRDSAVLRSTLVGRVWLVGMALTVALIWQQIAGWPARTKWQVKRANAEAVQVFRFPKKLAPEKWHRDLVRIVRDGRTLPCFASPEAFNVGTIESYLVRGNYVQVRAPQAGSFTWTILVPWVLDTGSFATVLIAAVLVTLVLIWFRNPVAIAVAERLRAPGTPWPALTLALLVFALAVIVRVRGFSYPSWENDSPSYFRSVFHVAEGGLPFATPDRPFAYPLVIGTLLRVFPDFRAILVLHMIASLVAATSIGAIVWLAGERLFENAVLRSLSRLLGIAVFASLALNEAILEREWALLSEAWAAFYLGVQAWLVWLLTCRKRPLQPSLWLFAALCLCGLLTFFTRANWGFALGLLPLPWAAACFLNADSRRSFWIWAASGAAVLIALAAATFAFQGYCKADTSRPYLYDRARALVCWHVPLVLVEIDRRLAEHPDESSRAVLTDLEKVLRDEIEIAKTRGTGSYPSLPVDPDYLYFNGLTNAASFRALPVEERTQLCMDLFKSGLKRHPEIYLRKVAEQMRLFFISPYQKPNIYLPDVAKGLARSEKALSSGRELTPRFAASYAPVVAEAKLEFARPWPSAARLAMSVREVLIFGFLTGIFTWCIAVPAAMSVICFCLPNARSAIDWLRIAPVLTAAAWSFGSAFLSALSSAATQGLDIQRYIQLSVPLTLLAQALWSMLGASLLLALGRHFVPAKNVQAGADAART